MEYKETEDKIIFSGTRQELDKLREKIMESLPNETLEDLFF